MQNNASPQQLTLKEMYERLVGLGVISSSRIAPIKTSLRHYAAFLNSDFAQCTPDLFLLPDQARNRLIESRLTRTKQSHRAADGAALSVSAVRNVKNDVSFVLRKAVEFDLLRLPADAPLATWKQARQAFGSTRRHFPLRGEMFISEKHILQDIPDGLRDELVRYCVWCTAQFNPQRPRSLSRRISTHQTVEKFLLRRAGFLVQFKGLSAESISLSTLVEPQNVNDFAVWFIESRGKVTSTAYKIFAHARALNAYLKISAGSAGEVELYEQYDAALKESLARLPRREVVCDKSKRVLSLKTLDLIGLKDDPFHPDWLESVSPRRADEVRKQLQIFEKEGQPQSTHYNFKRYAKRAASALMLRLLVRIPFRQRNLREMRWNPERPEYGQNLYRKDGAWFVKFSGPELKIGFKKGKVNTVNYQFPAELVPTLDRWLNLWRPLLAECATAAPVDPGNRDQQFVFLNIEGRPNTTDGLNTAIKKLTYKYGGVAVNPHNVRTIWATEYIKDTKDSIGAAYMLGDEVETVLANYADLLSPDAEAMAQSWLKRNLA